MRWAVVIDGVVDNIVLWNGGNWTPPPGATVVSIPVDSRCDIGWTYAGGVFVEPEP